MRRLLTGLLGVTLVLTACGDDDAAGDRAAVTSIPDETTTSSTTTTEPETVAPDVIPQDPSQITEDYVEQVLDALYTATLEATRLTREAGVVDEPAIRIIEATNSPAGAREYLNSLADAAASGFEGYREDLKPVDASVLEVLEVRARCIFAEVKFDTSGLSTEPGNAEEFRLFARLVSASEEQRASGLNPTAWVLDALPATSEDAVPSGQCEDP